MNEKAFVNVLGNLRRLARLEDYPPDLQLIVRHYARQVGKEAHLETGHAASIVAHTLADIWRQEVRADLKDAGPHKWGMALLPLLAYNIDEFLGEGMETYLVSDFQGRAYAKVRRKQVAKLLCDQEWVQKWVENRDLAQSIVATAQNRCLDDGTYDSWLQEGRRIFYKAVLKRLEACRAELYPVAPQPADRQRYYEQDQLVSELHRDILSAKSPFAAVIGRAPDRVVNRIVGAKDWETLLLWMGETAIEGGETEWALNMMEAVTAALDRSWRKSGWLLGAKIVGPLLRKMDNPDRGSAVKIAAETAVLDLLPPAAEPSMTLHRLGRSIRDSLQALAPLSDLAVSRLMSEDWDLDKQGWGREEVRRGLSGEPWFHPRRPQPSPARPKISLVEAVAQIAHLRPPQPGEYRDADTVYTLATTLSMVGTRAAAVFLGERLVDYAQHLETGPYDDQLADWLAAGLRRSWEGNIEDLCAGLQFVLAASAPWWVWHGYLQGVMALGGSDAAAHVAALMDKEGKNWSPESRQGVVEWLGGYGDERVIPYLVRWWDRAWKKQDKSGLRIFIGEALWGTEGERGVLVRQPTDWLIGYLEEAEASDDLLEMVAFNVLRPRYRGKDFELVAALGRRWLEQGAAKRSLPLMRAGAYLADTASRQQLDLLQELESGFSSLGRLHLAARMGWWEVVREELRKSLDEGPAGAWEAIELATEQQYLTVLPVLIDYYMTHGGTGWFTYTSFRRYRWQDIDRALDQLWEEKNLRFSYRVAYRLWELGTPGAVRRVLQALRTGAVSFRPAARFLHRLPQDYREAVSPLLIEFFNEIKEDKTINKYLRWDIFDALHYLWAGGSPCPWEVIAFFFAELEGPDSDLADQASNMLWGQIWGYDIYPWAGRVDIYREELRKLAMYGTERQRPIAVRWLEALELTEQAARKEAVEERSPTFLEDESQALLREVCRRAEIPHDNWALARDKALETLVSSRRYLPLLGQTVREGRAPDWWLLAAVASQGIVLEEADGMFYVRSGEQCFPLEEWAQW